MMFFMVIPCREPASSLQQGGSKVLQRDSLKGTSCVVCFCLLEVRNDSFIFGRNDLAA